MDRPDLNKAKEVATREDWDHRLPQYDKEADDGAGPSSNIVEPTSKLDALSLTEDIWKKYSEEEGDFEFRAQDDVIEGEPGEQEVRSEMGSLEDLYDLEGISEGKVQGGEVLKSAQLALSSLPGYIKEIGDRTILVDLSYLKSSSERKRTAGIIEQVIKIYSAIPGKVELEPSGKRGVFRFHVTNNFLSPTRTRSPSPAPNPDSGSSTKRLKIPPPVHSPLPELESGILLSPKYPGLPKCILKYGSHGLTPELISEVQSELPDLTLNQLLKYSLTQTKKGKRVINMYNLPQ